jgi:serine phosphatase RsbU (regulator of sigma subunit)/CRP-like cAMP-binding protein
MTTTTEKTVASLGLTTEDLHGISEWAETRTFPKDALIVKKGGQSDSLYIIIEGRVKLSVVDPTGKEAVLTTQGVGEYFGSLGFDEGPFLASVMTVEPSRLIVLTKSDFKVLLTRNNLFAVRVFEKLVRHVEELSRELTEVLKHMKAISEIQRVISHSPTNVQAVLDAVAENTGRLCNVTNAEILQVEGDELRLVAKHGMDKIWPIGFKIPINRNWVVGRAVTDRISVHVHDLQASGVDFPIGAGYAKQYGHRTVFATPLLIEGVSIGAILIRLLEVRPLKDNQIELLRTFADQAAIAIKNVRLFNEIQEKSRKVEMQAQVIAEWNTTLENRVAKQITQVEQFAKLEHEIFVASEIQKSMLPRAIPRFQGYEFCARMIPAKSVGGDFFDFIPIGSDTLGIAVGDVSDKGLVAALFMAMVRRLLRAEAQSGHSPKEVLQRVNHHLLDMNDKEMFVTILFGFLSRTTHRFQYVRAGHEAPIFIDRQGSIKRLPKARGQALGIFDRITLDEQTIEFSKDCMMLLYSDGISDATNRENERFGTDRIVHTLSHMPKPTAPMVCSWLINEVIEHQGISLQFDDMTVLVVRAVC